MSGQRLQDNTKFIDKTRFMIGRELINYITGSVRLVTEQASRCFNRCSRHSSPTARGLVYELARSRDDPRPPVLIITVSPSKADRLTVSLPTSRGARVSVLAAPRLLASRLGVPRSQARLALHFQILQKINRQYKEKQLKPTPHKVKI